MNYDSPSSSADPSPSSSPVLGPADSSPLSSPTLAPYHLDSPPPSRVEFSHPFAASTKATKRPPQHEKKSDTPPCTPFAESSKRSAFYRDAPFSRSLDEGDYLHVERLGASPEPHRTTRYLDHEERLWDDALRMPFDTGVGRIDLTNKRLKSIPPSIADLSSFFNTAEFSEQSVSGGRALSRVTTDPDVHPTRTRSFQRTKSIVDSEKDRDAVQLYLSGNDISVLPIQLFDVQRLTVLTLRGNQLTHIPHDICRLRNLRELNLSQNRLTYLPSEMHSMTLTNLSLYPNPFLQEPSRPHSQALDGALGSSRRTLQSRRSITKLFLARKEAESSSSAPPSLSSTTTFLHAVPPLTELCLRLLLSPVDQGDASHTRTILSEYYGVPLPDHWDDCIPSSVREMLSSCVRGVFRTPVKSSPTLSSHGTTWASRESLSYIGVGTCANPAHRGSLFVKHAAERFTWERKIAGVDVGGAVPLKWRGCLQNCLNFLDQNVDIPSKPRPLDFSPPRKTFAALAPTPVPASGPDSQMDVDMDAVQVVDLRGSDPFSMDEFDD